MEVYKIFAIEAARSLPNLPDGHPCKNIHGHSFKIIINNRIIDVLITSSPLSSNRSTRININNNSVTSIMNMYSNATATIYY